MYKYGFLKDFSIKF